MKELIEQIGRHENPINESFDKIYSAFFKKYPDYTALESIIQSRKDYIARGKEQGDPRMDKITDKKHWSRTTEVINCLTLMKQDDSWKAAHIIATGQLHVIAFIDFDFCQ